MSVLSSIFSDIEAAVRGLLLKLVGENPEQEIVDAVEKVVAAVVQKTLSASQIADVESGITALTKGLSVLQAVTPNDPAIAKAQEVLATISADLTPATATAGAATEISTPDPADVEGVPEPNELLVKEGLVSSTPVVS